MKFICTVRHATGRSWKEQFDRPNIITLAEAEDWAKATIRKFNETLRPRELPRILVSVVLDGDSESHLWMKTNLVTISDPKLGLYDTLECRVCGITGKRFGLGRSGIARDKKFKSSKYAKCTPGVKA
jgi:hypothetical protein